MADQATTVSSSGGSGVKANRRRWPTDTRSKPRRLLSYRQSWVRGQRRDTGAPFWIVPGDSGSHYTDLLACSCERWQFLRRSPEQACTHIMAVRLWYAAFRDHKLTDDPGEPHRKLRPGDREHFEAQDLVLSAIADSLLAQFEIGTSQPLEWDTPGTTSLAMFASSMDDDGLRQQLAHDNATYARTRHLAIVDDDGTTPRAVLNPPDERP
jgi:hypothetical protein